jgi:hypothetical protein
MLDKSVQPNGATTLGVDNGALAVGYDGTKSTTSIANARITAPLCPAGNVLIPFKGYSATIHVVPSIGSASTFYTLSGSVAYGGTGFNQATGFHDFDFQGTGDTTFTDSFSVQPPLSATTSYLTIYFGFNSSTPWVGTVTFDDIVIQ